MKCRRIPSLEQNTCSPSCSVDETVFKQLWILALHELTENWQHRFSRNSQLSWFRVFLLWIVGLTLVSLQICDCLFAYIWSICNALHLLWESHVIDSYEAEVEHILVECLRFVCANIRFSCPSSILVEVKRRGIRSRRTSCLSPQLVWTTVCSLLATGQVHPQR